ncbi:hypothetical protein P280DRAFT_466294 [Massarina eburnea CBS 473.64]|uniref:Uncharacterized protein n=1 Tax=Massarina eburnea CBS 473.64 TaxID=1395130 RepID=A0A6A6SFR5_9PLEO|nr:hypothetical protein P280DRAFT_466294 [Massarina eburnea CBS 473.64]
MPDLNSIPPSSRNPTTTSTSSNVNVQSAQATPGSRSAQISRQSSTSASRRTSQIYPMSPPPLPLASPSGTVPASTTQHSHAFPPLSPSVGHVTGVDAAGVPMRHPRPLTEAELYLELEKEQEAVVNRLTRELSALRAHTSSVASNTSSATSNVHIDHDITGPTHPTSARRHRSSSSVSRNSVPPYSIPLTSATTSIPHHRYSVSSQSATNDASAAQQARSASVVSTPRYEEVAHYRGELEEAKRENDVLKRRIRELERMIRGGAETDAQRGRRSASAQGNGAGDEAAATATTTASANVVDGTSSRS